MIDHSIRHLDLMKKSVGLKVKAAGGVRTLDDLIAVQKAGCTRCRATATVAMLDKAKEQFGS